VTGGAVTGGTVGDGDGRDGAGGCAGVAGVGGGVVGVCAATFALVRASAAPASRNRRTDILIVLDLPLGPDAGPLVELS